MAIGDPYVTSAELEAHISGGTSTESAAGLLLAVQAASRWVEGWCRRQFNKASTSSARLYRVTNPGRIWVDDIATSTVTVGDGTGYTNTWDAADFLLEPIGALNYGATGEPYTSLSVIGARRFLLDYPGLVQVTATWGWPAVPEDVKQATLIQAARLFKRRESTSGVLGGNDFGIVRVGTRVDPDVSDLLQRYRLVGAVA
jgi:hypothetical protein